MHLFFWHLANRVRLAFGRPAQPKRCCRNPQNLGTVELGSPDSRITFRRCTVCSCRHFEMTAEPGRLGMRLV